jgi:hypothetical protein
MNGEVNSVGPRSATPRDEHGVRGAVIRKNDRANQQVIVYLVWTAIIRSEYI